jgi:hypothetical protein
MPKENVMPEIPPIITHVLVHKCKGQNQLKRKQKKRATLEKEQEKRHRRGAQGLDVLKNPKATTDHHL